VPARSDAGYAEAIRKLHGAILGITSLIEAFPYAVEGTFFNCPTMSLRCTKVDSLCRMDATPDRGASEPYNRPAADRNDNPELRSPVQKDTPGYLAL